MVRLKKTYKDGTVSFTNFGCGIESAFTFSRKYIAATHTLKQIDIYENSKLIASVYG